MKTWVEQTGPHARLAVIAPDEGRGRLASSRGPARIAVVHRVYSDGTLACNLEPVEPSPELMALPRAFEVRCVHCWRGRP